MNTGITVAEAVETPIDGGVIDQAVAVLETGERIGASLTLADVAIHFGVEEANRGQRALDALKARVPEGLKFRDHFLTRAEKVGRVALAVNGCQAELPSATERFDRDKPFWDCMKIEDPWQAYLFEKAHFARTELDLSGRTLPAELGWLAAADADTFSELQKLQRHGLRLRTLTKSPAVALNSVTRIAEDTQKTFVHTWLPQFLHESQKPILTEVERQHDYDGELDTIDALRQRALCIETDDKLDEREQSMLDRTNLLLSDGLAGELVLRRVLHDYAARESEGLSQMLPMLVALSGAAWGVEKFAPNDVIRAFAKVAGSGDDIATEVMSLSRLKLSKEKLRSRLKWFVPLAVGMMAADTLVDKVDASVNPHLGGLMYGTTTVGLSAASSIGSLKEHAQRYRELVAEGKVRSEDVTGPNKVAREHYIYHDPLRKGIVAGVLGGPAVCAALWPWVANKPYIYVPLGAIEPIAAMASTTYAEKRLPHKFKKYVREQTALLTAAV